MNIGATIAEPQCTNVRRRVATTWVVDPAARVIVIFAATLWAPMRSLDDWIVIESLP